MPSNEIEIVLQPYGMQAKIPLKTTILQTAKNLGIEISSLCGGKGTCGKCKVKIRKGFEGLNSLTENELEHLSEEEIMSGIRLACQAKVTVPSIVFIPERSRVGKQRLQTEGLVVPIRLNPLVRKYFLRLPKPTLHDSRSDEDRLLDTLRENCDLANLTIDYELAKNLPIELRKRNWEVTAVAWKNIIISVEPGDTTDRCFGFAVDVGSTKLAGFLMNLNDGGVVSIAARMNPQISFGEDILSRLSYVLMHGTKAQNELQNAVVSGINEMIDECCERASVKPEAIYELNFVGNTAMQMLFLKLWPQYTALSPYPSVVRHGIDVKASRLGLKSHWNANAYYLPVIGGFVGADSVADLMAVDMLESEETILDIDIGTNTEIALGNKDLVTIVSCASGPAFEGMQIKYGMRAATGAIEKISINPSSLETLYRTIEDAPPVGICGSGLVDAASELLIAGIINTKGTFIHEMMKETNRIRRTPEGWEEYVIAWEDETATDTDITITQADIRELQKAKGAIRAGAEIVLKRMSLSKDDITTLYIAGAFGNYIDPESARNIGMYPEVPIDRIKFVGNTAGTGSRMCLISKEMREYAERISESVRYYELATDPDFQTEYMQAMFLPHQNLSKHPILIEMLRRLERIK